MQVPVEETQVQKEKEQHKSGRQRELIKRAQGGDAVARDTFVQENMGLVYHVVKRFMGRGHEMEDLAQIGCIGLLKAIQNFNLDYDVCFSTYAVYLISGEIRRFLRDDGMIKVSRTIKENGIKLWRCKEELLQKLGREATINELAEASGMTKEDIVVALEANADVDSIDRETFVMTGVEQQESVLDRIVVKQMLERLEEKDRMLIVLRYQKGLTQTQVGKQLHMSQVQISRREKKILENMRRQLE
jgi:RNA polymerase sporulation-specific sigma factor